MCRYFCIEFIDFMFKGKTLTDFTNLFLLQNFKKIDEGILNYFLKYKHENINMSDIKEVFLRLDDPLKFRLSRLKEIDFFIDCLCCQVQAVAFLFSHLVLSLVGLLG